MGNTLRSVAEWTSRVRGVRATSLTHSLITPENNNSKTSTGTQIVLSEMVVDMEMDVLHRLRK